jgi:hypothetical protein
VPGEDGVAARSEDDVNRPEGLWPARLHQHDLSRGSAGGVDYPPDCVGQPEGFEAPGVDDDEELQEAGPGAMRGPSISAARRRGVATTPVVGGAASCGPGPFADVGRGPRVSSTSQSTRSIPGERGAGAAATSDGAFRAPPGAGPRWIKALEAPEVTRFALSCLDAPMRRGPPSGGDRAGIFALFLLPGGRPRCFTPEIDPAAAEEAEGSIAWGALKKK